MRISVPGFLKLLLSVISSSQSVKQDAKTTKENLLLKTDILLSGSKLAESIYIISNAPLKDKIEGKFV